VLVALPLTVRLRTTGEGLTILQFNAPLVLYTETDTIVLPPDTTAADGTTVPFYVDPLRRPGLHRDVFREHAQKLEGALREGVFRLTRPLQCLVHPTWEEAVANSEQTRAEAEAEAKTAEERRRTEADAAEAEAMGMYIVEAILDERPIKSKKKRKGVVESNADKEYLVKWLGFEEQTWEKERSLKKLNALSMWKASSGSQAQPSTSSS
jgi:hypothetical protein